jgi:hypothetical protein
MEVDLSETQLIEICEHILSNDLIKLDCNHNYLVKIPILPITLKKLCIVNNKIEKIENLPKKRGVGPIFSFHSAMLCIAL